MRVKARISLHSYQSHLENARKQKSMGIRECMGTPVGVKILEINMARNHYRVQENHNANKSLLNNTMAVYVRYNSWYISLPS